MVDHSVKLISPCNASDRWPLGYYVFQEGTFTDGESLRNLLTDMINQHMKTSVRHDQVVAFRPDLKYEDIDNGFRLSSAFLHHNFNNVSDYLRDLVQGVYEGKQTAGELALKMERQHETPLEETFYNLNSFLKNGFLNEEPEPAVL